MLRPEPGCERHPESGWKPSGQPPLKSGLFTAAFLENKPLFKTFHLYPLFSTLLLFLLYSRYHHPCPSLLGPVGFSAS